MAIREHKLF